MTLHGNEFIIDVWDLGVPTTAGGGRYAPGSTFVRSCAPLGLPPEAAPSAALTQSEREVRHSM